MDKNYRFESIEEEVADHLARNSIDANDKVGYALDTAREEGVPPEQGYFAWMIATMEEVEAHTRILIELNSAILATQKELLAEIRSIKQDTGAIQGSVVAGQRIG